MAAMEASSRFCCQGFSKSSKNIPYSNASSTSKTSKTTFPSNITSKSFRIYGNCEEVSHLSSYHKSPRQWDKCGVNGMSNLETSFICSFPSVSSPLGFRKSVKSHQNSYYGRRKFFQCDATSSDTAEPDNGGLDSSNRNDRLPLSQRKNEDANNSAGGGGGGGGSAERPSTISNLDTNPNLETNTNLEANAMLNTSANLDTNPNLESSSDYDIQGPWDLSKRRRRIEEVASRMGDPLRDMVTTASRKLQEYLEMHKSGSGKLVIEGSGGSGNGSGSLSGSGSERESERERERESEEKKSHDSEWAKWEKVFAEVEEKYNLLEALQFQLDEAVDQEDFKEAARLKLAFESCGYGDPMATSIAELQAALRDERYKDAARLRDQTATDLMGWWVGLGEGVDDPYGRIVNISAMQGRLIARSYNAKQLAAAAPGIPVFEIFVTREEDRNYRNQPVFLRRRHQLFGRPSEIPKNGDEGGEGSDTMRISVDDNSDILNDLDDNNSGKKAFEDGFAKAVDLLKDKMNGGKGNVIQVVNPEDIGGENLVKAVLQKMAEAANAIDKSEKPEKGGVEGGVEGGGDQELPSDDIEQLLQKIIDASESREGVNNGGESVQIDDEKINDQEFSTSFGDIVGEDLNLNVSVSVQMQNSDIVDSGNSIGDKFLSPFERIPARIERRTRDEFAFHIEADDEIDTAEALNEGEGGWKMSAVLTVKGSTGTPTSDTGPKRTWNMEDLPMKPKDIHKIVQMAMKQAKRGALTKTTSFRRINLEEANSDPLCGLYIGAFGPYTSEIVQLRRKFGRWEDDPSETPYEYVEAVKLTGDLNVPAGEVTFRAKVGRLQRQSFHGIYPDELGVVSRYKGQGRLAEHGFKNPRWIDGELILLDGKFVVGGPRQAGRNTNGAELGFVYSVPERHFLVLFNRLKLRN